MMNIHRYYMLFVYGYKIRANDILRQYSYIIFFKNKGFYKNKHNYCIRKQLKYNF